MKPIAIISLTISIIFAASSFLAIGKSEKPYGLYPSENDISLNQLLDSVKTIRKTNVSESLRLSAKAVRLADSLSEPLWKARFLCNQGISYSMLKMYDEALNSQYDALLLFQRFHDSAHIAKSMYEIGNIYALLNDYERALSYHFNALYLREYDSDKILRAKSYLPSAMC